MQKMEFKVNGITFENEDGKDIQKLIKKELKELFENGLIEEKWEGYTNSEIKEMDLEVWEYSDVDFFIKIKEDVFEGKKCVKVYIENNDGNYIHIGYIPKKCLKEYEEKSKNAIKISGVGELTGGKLKKCVWIEDDYEEKETVETVDFNYGMTVELSFSYATASENNFKLEKESEKNKQTNLNEEIFNKKVEEILSKKDDREDHKEIEYVKRKIRTGLIICSTVFAISFFVMPLGIISLFISIIGLKKCFKALKKYNLKTLT